MDNSTQNTPNELCYDWQINLVEGEKNIYKSTNKFENVEINFLFKVKIIFTTEYKIKHNQ